jgi:hypothetical protein
VLAGENLRQWLACFPDDVGAFLLRGFATFHSHNPFGIMSYYLEHDAAVAWERTVAVQALATVVIGLLLWRSARRLQGHFHELHYQPARDVSDEKRPKIVDAPLTWWAVKRVSRYSGRINLWLAGGFGLLYALYTVAGPQWPDWLGTSVFQLCDRTGGIPAVATALVLLAAVPAAFQYGLWDSSAQDRCRRLELLLLTRLQARDYWDAAAAAAWQRGRGYFFVALALWGAAVAAGQASVVQAAGALAAAVLLWCLYFVLGFRAFSRGMQANGLGLLLTLALPLVACFSERSDLGFLTPLFPPGSVYAAAARAPGLLWALGPALAAAVALVVGRIALARCETELRRWYEKHHGHKLMS